MKMISAAVAVAFTASTCLADANVQQKTQVHIGGAIGAVVNVFSRSAREGVISDTVVKGNRKLTRSGDGGEIIDLGEEKVYTIDFNRKTFTVKTFADLRREFEEQQERARKDAEKQAKSDKNEGPEYEVEFDVKTTGNKQTINGWDTREEIVTVTVHEKGKKIEKSGGWVLTSDNWMGPKVPAMREIYEFDRKFAQKIYGTMIGDMRQLAVVMATTPAFAKAMKTMSEKRASFEGTPILTKMTFETVAGTDTPPQQQAQSDSGSSSPTSVSGAVLGGLMNRVKQRREEKKVESGQSPNRSTLFDSSSELTKAASVATTEEVSIPAGFKQR